MSSLFNYELDEKNIRSTLQEVRLSVYSDSAWTDFEENYAKPLHKPSAASFIKFPDIQLNINRNVVLPLFFILALVGVSAIMLSFIDFKSADGTKAEKKLEPNANNYKATTASPVISPPKKVVDETRKPIVKTELVKSEVKPQPSTLSSPVTTVVATINASTLAISNSQAAVTKPAEIISNSQKAPLVSVSSTTIQNAYHKLRRKKAEKVPEEQLETIKAPTLIKSESEESEPELEIKVD